jgi:hypothetical protein
MLTDTAFCTTEDIINKNSMASTGVDGFEEAAGVATAPLDEETAMGAPGATTSIIINDDKVARFVDNIISVAYPTRKEEDNIVQEREKLIANCRELLNKHSNFEHAKELIVTLFSYLVLVAGLDEKLLEREAMKLLQDTLPSLKPKMNDRMVKAVYRIGSTELSHR